MTKFGMGATPGLIPGIICCWKPNPGCKTEHINIYHPIEKEIEWDSYLQCG
jgi:hypothetical protein